MLLSEKGEGLMAEYALNLVLIAILVIATLMSIGNAIDGQFDRQFDEGLITIDSSVIPINSEFIEHPVAVPEVKGIPGTYPTDHPRYLLLDGCIQVKVPQGATILHASAPVSPEIASRIVIQMPVPGASTIEICPPDEVSTQIYLWFE